MLEDPDAARAKLTRRVSGPDQRQELSLGGLNAWR